MNLPFSIKFFIFNEHENTTKKQNELRKSMIVGEILKNMLKNAFVNDNNYKFLDRVEPSISSIDEKKQLRLRIDSNHKESRQYQHSLHFHQEHCARKEYFSIDELKYISHKIKIELEEFLNYEIDDSIIYIEI